VIAAFELVNGFTPLIVAAGGERLTAMPQPSYRQGRSGRSVKP
jgi:hypothetical protein